jgi:hypothetical protein
MNAHQGGSRRSRKPAPRRSFKPEFDLLETRNLLSGLVAPIALPPNLIGPPIVLPPPGGSLDNGVVTVNPDHLEVTRGGDPGTFSVVLDSAPTAEVDVTLAQFNLGLLATALTAPTVGAVAPPIPVPGGDTPLTITPAHLTFMPGNWSTAQTVSVSAPAGDGSDSAACDSLGVFGTTTSADPNFDAQAVPPVTVTVVNHPVNTTGVIVSTDNLDVTRGGGSDTYTVALASKPTADVTITITQFSPILDPLPPVPWSGQATPTTSICWIPEGCGPGGSEPLTVTPTTLTFTPDDWQTAQPVTVSAPADPNAPPDQGVLLLETVTSQDPNYNNFPAPTVFVRVEENAVLVTPDHLRVTRGGDGDQFDVRLASAPAADVTITVAQAGPVTGTGANDSLQLSPTTLTFTADDWYTPQTVTVSPPATGSGDQTDQLTLTAASTDPNYNNIAIPDVTVSVIDPSVAQPKLVIAPDHLELTPGASDSFTVALATQPSGNVTVTIDEIALPLLTAGVDVTLPPIPIGNVKVTIAPTMLTFTPDDWQMPQPVTVTAPADATRPGFAVLEETAASSDGNYDGLRGEPVFVRVEGSTPGTVDVSTDHLKLTRDGASDSFTVNLGSKPAADVTITIAQVDPTADPRVHDPLGIAPTTLTFTPDDWQTAQPVTVSPPATGTGDQFDFLSLTASSSDPAYNNIPIPGVGVEVLDTAGLVVSAQKLDLQAGGSDNFTVALASKPSDVVTVTISQAALPSPLYVDGDGTVPPVGVGADVQLTIAPTTLTFTPDDWQTAQTVTVTAPADVSGSAIAILDETAASSDPSYDGKQGQPVYVTVEGSTTPGKVDVSIDHLKLTRGGDSDSFTVNLDSQPTGDVTITVSQIHAVLDPPFPPTPGGSAVVPVPGPGGDPLGIAPTTLTFTPDDWQTAQTVTVSPPTTGSGDQFDLLSLTAASSDPAYNNIPVPGVIVAVIDPAAQQAGLVVSKDHLDVTPGGSDSYTVALASKPSGDVTVTVTSANVPGAVLPGDASTGGVSVSLEPVDAGPVFLTTTTLTFTPDDWNTPQPVTITAPADAKGPGGGALNETAASSDPNYDGLQGPSLSVELEGSSTVTTNPGSLVLSKDELQVTPGTGGDSYTIALASKPTADVTITIAQGDALAQPVGVAKGVALPMSPLWVGPPVQVGDVPLTITPTTLTFTPDNWNTGQTVTVSAAASQDGTPFGGLGWLNYTVKSDDPSYNGLQVPATSVFVKLAEGDPLPLQPPVFVPPVLPPIEVLALPVSATPQAVQASVTVHAKPTPASQSHTGNKPSVTVHNTGSTTTTPNSGTTHHGHHGKGGKKPHHGKH